MVQPSVTVSGKVVPFFRAVGLFIPSYTDLNNSELGIGLWRAQYYVRSVYTDQSEHTVRSFSAFLDRAVCTALSVSTRRMSSRIGNIPLLKQAVEMPALDMHFSNCYI